MGNEMTLVLNEIRNLSNKIVNIEGTMVTKQDLKGMATREDIANMATKQDLEGMATREDIANMATREDIANMATKQDLEGMATREDIANMATKQDLEGMATREDIADMATKQDLEGMATKQDLESMATKQDLEILTKDIDRLHEKFDGITKQVAHNTEKLNTLEERLEPFASIQEHQRHLINLLSKRSINHEARLDQVENQSF